MATGSFESGDKGIILYDCGNTQKDFINGDTATLTSGVEVTLIGVRTVRKRAAGEVLAGVVIIGAEVGDKAVVAVTYQNIMRAATSVAITAGDNIVPSGTVLDDNRPQYIAAVAGNSAYAVALSTTTGGADEELIVGINSHPVVIA